MTCSGVVRHSSLDCTLLVLVLPEISAALGGMSLPDGVIPGVQALEHSAQSFTEPPLNLDQQTEVQLEPRGVKSAECQFWPGPDRWAFIVDFRNCDPAKDVKAADFEKILENKFGKDKISDFWWKKLSTSTRFMFDVPYPGGERGQPYPKMEKLVSDAIFEYSGKAGLRTTCWHV